VEELPVLGVSGMVLGVGALTRFTSFASGPPRCHPNMLLLRNAGGAPCARRQAQLPLSCAWRSSYLLPGDALTDSLAQSYCAGPESLVFMW
jgi:hypothetical protein